MSIETICQANRFDNVHAAVLKMSNLTTDPLEKRVLKDLLSRLVEFRSNISESLSIIKSSSTVESSSSQKIKCLEESLLQRQNGLTFLDSAVSRIDEEIQQLLARKDKLVSEKKSALAKMEAANKEASRELGELKRERR
ncbi:hypothetical protein LINGRAHAP2_LOCUS4566 [Linum grandiflorum]